jgi:hypothetical protein
LGCAGEPETGPVEVHWDRDSCERCRMALSDRRFAAEVRLGARDVLKFDDLGCAVIWLDRHPTANAAESWVTDHRDGEWLDARRAHYRQLATSPMDYGYGATREKTAGVIDFEAVARLILEKERGQHRGGPAGRAETR